MLDLRYRWRLRKLQKEREKINRQSELELKGIDGEKRQELMAQWDWQFNTVQEEIDECLSDHIRQQAERLDVSLPKVEEGPFWEQMHLAGDRLILTIRGREETREKIQKGRRYIREEWSSYIGMVATIGSILIALLAIYFRK